MITTQNIQHVFEDLGETLFAMLSGEERACLYLKGEVSNYTRISGSKVRQTGTLTDSNVTLSLSAHSREASEEFPLVTDPGQRNTTLSTALNRLRERISLLPEDPHCVVPESASTSSVISCKPLPPMPELVREVLTPAQGNDLVGILTTGLRYHGVLSSVGAHHWHESSTCTVDTSLVSPGHHMVKILIGGDSWKPQVYLHQLERGLHQLKLLENLPAQDLAPGEYRAWLSPLAVKSLLAICSRAGYSETAMQTGTNPLKDFWSGARTLNPLVTLDENLDALNIPRFTSMGDSLDATFSLVSSGNAGSPLTSCKSAARYNKPLRGGLSWEGARSLVLAPGTLDASDADSLIGDGIYLQHLHYLNWSDQQNGRITGLTRYACYQVADGKPVATLRTRRFDDTFVELFGEKLVDLENTCHQVPEIYNYDGPAHGGAVVPGILVDGFRLTQ